MIGYVYIHKLGCGEYEAIGCSYDGYYITSPVYSKNYNKAYNKIYYQLKNKKLKKLTNDDLYKSYQNI